MPRNDEHTLFNDISPKTQNAFFFTTSLFDKKSIMSRKVMLVGWDAADWKVIQPLLDAGKMPNLAAFIAAGVRGNMATLQPCLSPMLWSSIATGKRAYKHGIYGFSEPDPVSGAIRPVTNLSRRTKAIWNILNQEGKNTITVGWWPSNPAEPLSRGVMVSNDYQSAHHAVEDWPLKPGTIHPERLAERLKDLRFHPGELEEADLRPFLPGLEGMTAEELKKASESPRMNSLRKTIADCTSIHSAATALMQNEPWDLLCVYYDAVDHFGHGFMRFHPPQQKGVDDFEYRLYHHVIEAGYRYHDMMLGTLLQLAGPETTVILMSDHGFHPDDQRLSSVPREPAGPAAEHRHFGIFAARGPDLKRGGQVYGANLLDICPTLLHLFGLPMGEDMDGKVLAGIYEDEPSTLALPKIPSWDLREGDHGMHPPDRQIAAEDSKAALEQLIALGYIDKPDADQSVALEQTVRELDYNLAQSYLDGGIYTEAVTILERLYERWPLEHRFGFKLATCYQQQNRPAELRALVTTICERRLKEGEEALAELKATVPADEAAAEAEKARIEAMTDPEKQKHFAQRRELIGKSRPNLFSLRYLEATALASERQYEAALEKLTELDHEYGARRQALVLRGNILQHLKRWDEAETAFEEALAGDREAPAPLLGLARNALGQKKYELALARAQASLDLLYFQPFAHYLCGMAHYRLGRWTAAEACFITCIQQAPLYTAALRMLRDIARFYRRDGEIENIFRVRLAQTREQLAALRDRRRQEVETIRQPHQSPAGHDYTSQLPELKVRPEALSHIPEKDIITIVSGLPRSGTSLMMQIIEAAGLPIFTDGQRAADESNQKGYYEHDRVAGLLTQRDRSWLRSAKGQTLKVVSPLLAALPKQLAATDTAPAEALHYRVLYMERPMEEILASQSTMIARLGRQAPPSGDIAKAYTQQVRHAKTWINGHGISALTVPYPDLVHHPEALLQHIATFLGCAEKLPAMRAVIDPSLHRARKETSKS
jgi:tetratricopeptide (TPR) repeat protein